MFKFVIPKNIKNNFFMQIMSKKVSKANWKMCGIKNLCDRDFDISSWQILFILGKNYISVITMFNPT